MKKIQATAKDKSIAELAKKARSKANLTFVVQLANGGGTYLPCARAVKGDGYGAVIQSNTVGPEGGQVLVEETLKMINGTW